MRRGDQHIVAQVRHRGMRRLSAEIDFKAIERGHHGPGFNREMTGWNIREIMHAENPLRGKLFEQAFADHLVSTGAAFFRWLKNKINSPIKTAVAGQVMGCTEQHGAMPVVAAGMHFSAVAGCVLEPVLLLDK